ncbi:MAG: molybdopterin molybdotransferase MoeA [Campylobacterales bacterium]|nr:molybdopterin molybdotransferase MoeA [Campylobacterales bacterium]
MGICIKEALRLINLNIHKVSFEVVPIENCGGRISAQEVYARYALPTYNNSAMDGFGVKLHDAGKQVKVIDDIFAGSHKETPINSTEAIKIMTGARVPSSVEAVVPVELIEQIDTDHIKLPNDIKLNQHIRFTGEDIQNGELLLSDGDEINFATITLLASQGITHIKVYRTPKVSVFTSGEELKLHYEQIKEYQVYNSNTPTLLERVKELGCDVTFTGMAQDNIESLKQMIENSLHADLIITTGGISVGEADFTKEAFGEFNMDIIFNGIDIKPGKPTVFGKIGSTFVINLPGNPLAASLIFESFATVIIQKLTGNKNIYHNYIETKMGEDLQNKKGRTTLIPGFFDGRAFYPEHKRLPGMVSVLSRCNSMIILNRNLETLSKNDTVKVIPINWKFFTDKLVDFFN